MLRKLNAKRISFPISETETKTNENQQCVNHYLWYYNKRGESKKVPQTDDLTGIKQIIEEGYYKSIQSSDLEAIFCKLEQYVETYNCQVKDLESLESKKDEVPEEKEIKISKEEADKVPQEKEINDLKKEANSVLEEEIKKLKESIDQVLENFKNLLKTKFIYEEKAFSPFDNIYLNQEKFHTTIETRFTRPNIEALFFDKNKLFSLLIDQLVATNDDSLFEAFIASLTKTKIPENKLFAWNENMKAALATQIDDLNHYAQVLMSKNRKEKSQHISNLVKELKTQLQAQNMPDQNEVNLATKFRILQFKLAFTKALHQEDSIVNRHDGARKILTNMCTIFFTVGIPNLIRKLITGNSFFCSQTRTEEKIEAMQGTLFTKEKIFNLNSNP